MATVAEQLLRAREARRMTVEQVADITKIRSDHIRALEEGNFEVFSAPVYIRGFVRTYSTLLKLDVPRVMSELDSELGQTQKFSEPPALSNPANGPLDKLMLWLSKVDMRKALIAAVIILVLLVVIIASSAWRTGRTVTPSSETKPLMYKPGGGGDKLAVPQR